MTAPPENALRTELLIRLTPESHAFIERVLAAGVFSDAGEVIDQALLQLDLKIRQTVANILAREARGETLEEIAASAPPLDS